MIRYQNYQQAINRVQEEYLQKARKVHSLRWQGVDISRKPEMATYEALHISFAVWMGGYEWDLESLARDIAPNMPWAEDHFQERVCGWPINPGIQWKKWPYGQHAARFLDEYGKFNHNYMERYWPKEAGSVYQATETPQEFIDRLPRPVNGEDKYPMSGIRYEYGDLNDVVKLLSEDAYTRQAYLPVFFPEDTGGGNKRAPCTLGYHFIMREDELDITYYIRSCDMLRHFRDDIYLTHRLALWVIEEVAKLDPKWKEVTPGTFNMHITSLHIFANDWRTMFPNTTPPR